MRRIRSLFVSDLHLGTRECQAERLLALFRDYHPDKLYLLGDIIDLWAMERRVHWPASHNAVIHRLLDLARAGIEVTFIPGNHDGALRAYDGLSLGDIRIRHEAVHHAACGKRLLLVHGDCFDDHTRYHRWIALAGDAGYASLMMASRLVAALRRRLGRVDHWSLADVVKRRLPGAVAYVEAFELAAAEHAARHGYDGVICGHIHVPAVKRLADVTYHNCGDWVDSASALLEHLDGRMEILRAPALAQTERRSVARAA